MMSGENPDELFCKALAHDQEAMNLLMHAHPGYVFRKCNTGDKDAVVLLLQHFGDEAKRDVQSKISNPFQARIDASEILSDTCLCLLDRFDDPTQSQIQRNEELFDNTPRQPITSYQQLKSWFMTIVECRLNDKIRWHDSQKRTPKKESHRHHSDDTSSISGYEPQADESTVSARAILKEEKAREAKLIDKLPEEPDKLQSIYKLHKEGFTLSQISDKLKIGNVASVKKRIATAKKMVEDQMRRNF
jgi:DNA-directed RNA polymerase specialized sigma24 family protein